MASTCPPPTAGPSLRALLAALGPGCVWRPVPGPDGGLLALGDGANQNFLNAYLAGLDVAGKSVADLGCNLGYFSFLVRRMGAREVIGLDSTPEIIRVAEALAAVHGLTGIRFVVMDFLRQRPETPCDMALLIDFIGRRTIAKGRLSDVAVAATAWGARELLFTLRPSYPVDELPLPPQALRRLYPGFVHQGRFWLLDCLTASLGPGWSRRSPADPVGAGPGDGGIGVNSGKVPVIYCKTGA